MHNTHAYERIAYMMHTYITIVQHIHMRHANTHKRTHTHTHTPPRGAQFRYTANVIGSYTRFTPVPIEQFVPIVTINESGATEVRSGVCVRTCMCVVGRGAEEVSKCTYSGISHMDKYHVYQLCRHIRYFMDVRTQPLMVLTCIRSRRWIGYIAVFFIAAQIDKLLLC